MQALGRRLARHRLNRNLTQAALAAEAGVSKLTVHRIEQGHSLQAVNLIRILRALGLLDNLDAVVPEPAISPIQQSGCVAGSGNALPPGPASRSRPPNGHGVMSRDRSPMTVAP